MGFWIGLGIGCLVGGIAVLVVVCLCFAAKRGDQLNGRIGNETDLVAEPAAGDEGRSAGGDRRGDRAPGCDRELAGRIGWSGPAPESDDFADALRVQQRISAAYMADAEREHHAYAVELAEHWNALSPAERDQLRSTLATGLPVVLGILRTVNRIAADDGNDGRPRDRGEGVGPGEG